eukprot:TRINITY_DN15690_c0_g1_i4.p1 TRINITY_DN15690_c0_g1~~TRINITY_DN15690_c0_g1_i4.p1  ORF type:complete len:196 (+),score=21.15 TRINITY_DN15690_c0_g1_i4:69-656(+)
MIQHKTNLIIRTRILVRIQLQTQKFLFKRLKKNNKGIYEEKWSEEQQYRNAENPFSDTASFNSEDLKEMAPIQPVLIQVVKFLQFENSNSLSFLKKNDQDLQNQQTLQLQIQQQQKPRQQQILLKQVQQPTSPSSIDMPYQQNWEQQSEDLPQQSPMKPKSQLYSQYKELSVTLKQEQAILNEQPYYQFQQEQLP